MKIKRKLMAHYVDASTTTTPEYVRLGKDLEDFSAEMSANVETKRNILGETSVLIDSYEKSGSVEPFYAEEGDPLFTRLQKIIDEQQTLDDLKTTVVDVHLWEQAEESGKPVENTFIAYREEAMIEATSYGGDTTGYQIPFTLHYTGTRVKGTFNTSTKAFTEDT